MSFEPIPPISLGRRDHVIDDAKGLRMPQGYIEVLKSRDAYLTAGIQAVRINLEIQPRPHADDQVLPVAEDDRTQIGPGAFCEVRRHVVAHDGLITIHRERLPAVVHLALQQEASAAGIDQYLL